MKHKRFKKAKDFEWIQPLMKGYLMQCCDCALVHRMDFRIVGEKVQFRASRANRYTAAQRKRNRIIVKDRTKPGGETR